MTTSRSEVHLVLDNRRTPCAVGLLRAGEQIRGLHPGQALEIRSRDRFSPMEVVLRAPRERHRVEGVESVGRRAG